MPIALTPLPLPLALPATAAGLPDWRPGMLLQLLRDATGAWQAKPADAPGGPVWDATALVRSLNPALLAGGDVGLLLRVIATQPRLQLELLAPPFPEASVNDALDSPTLATPTRAFQAELPPWLHGKASEPAGAEPYQPAQHAQDWARLSLPALAAGRSLPEPFEDSLWLQALPLAGDLRGQAGPHLSLMLPWHGEMLGVQMSGRAAALEIDLILASPLAMALARSRWPHWDGALARAGARVQAWRWRRRSLSSPARREAVRADPDLLVLAAELLWSL
ncbi:hypothetical protein ACG04R_20120 [Roseateles sp. BYS78W]|uniref:Flagellar hook-length control protein FliK n=1 Tax=Pelomonas candidula TaxID=3299025 RepID=A0ABW7HGG3_9BURK